MKKFLRWFLIIVVLLVIAYLAGPHPSAPVYKKELPAVPAAPAALEGYIQAGEAQHKLKPDNQARIVWASDSIHHKTPYAIVYLHGFSASQAEGDPVHRNIAKEFGCNLYLSRLSQHGLDTTEPMMNLTTDNYWESAEQALAIGKQLGDKVILMGTSTGGSNALQLAAAYPDDIAALVLMSPNIAINNDKAWLLNNPWGLQIAKMVTGKDHIEKTDTGSLYRQYWYYRYPLQATVQLEELLETSMVKETFEKVKQPTLMLYYYKDPVHQDSTVKVDAMLTMFSQLGTPEGQKRKQAMPNAGDHVIGSYIVSKDVAGVQSEIEKFMKEVVGLQPVK
jgi:pimeloyl-ACP methyl ester carboxylesterase